MLSIQDLREQRAVKAQALKALVEKEKWDAVIDQPIYDALMSETDDLQTKIKRIQDSNALLAETALDDMIAKGLVKAEKDKKLSPQGKLYAKWLRAGDKGLTAEDWTSIRATMSTTTPNQGGFTVQTDIVKTLLDALKLYGGMRQVATVFQTAQGNPMSFPTSDGTTETGEIIAENVTATAADPVFNTVPLNVYKFSSKVVAVPFELLQDSAIDIEAFVRLRLATRLGRIQNTKFTLGTGTAEPTGLITAATTGVTAANATLQVTAILYDSIINLIHSVDPAYRSPTCKFMMNDLSVRNIRLIKDTSGRPIFVPGWDATRGGEAFAAPDTLCGYAIQTNQDMAQMAASAKSIAFGDLSYYNIRDVMDITMFRFEDSAYVKLGQVGFLAWMRSGGNLIDIGGAVKLFVNAAS